MLYTGNGDKGTTSYLGSARRVPKNALVIESLGALDELNSLLGVCRAKADMDTKQLLLDVQNDLFTIQAEIAGSSKRIGGERTVFLSETTDLIEKEMPPIRTFFVAGEVELSAFFDLARTVARRAERALVGYELEVVTPSPAEGLVRGEVLSYMNRLSSLLYAFARREAQKSGIKERPPEYR